MDSEYEREEVVMAERGTGPRGLDSDLEDMLDNCVELFGDTWFTVSMFCLGRQGATAQDCIRGMKILHGCGCLRKPVNDGGQEYFQVMPGIVYPKKQVGARS